MYNVAVCMQVIFTGNICFCPVTGSCGGEFPNRIHCKHAGCRWFQGRKYSCGNRGYCRTVSVCTKKYPDDKRTYKQLLIHHIHLYFICREERYLYYTIGSCKSWWKEHFVKGCKNNSQWHIRKHQRSTAYAWWKWTDETIRVAYKRKGSVCKGKRK